MNGILFAESIEVEFNALYEACNNAIAYAYSKYMEESISPFYYLESSKESGGLVGFAKSALKAIGDLLRDIYKKIKSILFGSKINKEATNVEIKVEKDPNKLMNYLTNFYQHGTNLLDKASKGEVSVDEAREFVRKENVAFDAIGSIAITAGSLFGALKLNERFINKWKDEIEDAYRTIEIDSGDGSKTKLSVNAEEKYTRTESNEGKQKIINETTKIIVDHMNSTSTKGLKAIEGAMKSLFAKNYITTLVKQGEMELTDKKALKEAKKREKLNTKRTHKFVKGINKELEQIDRGVGAKNELNDSYAHNKAKRNEALNKRYTDSERYVDDDDLNKKSVK